MPTNVTPEYKKAEEAYREAKALDEKIERLEDMISLLPKHKGTDHLFADLKRKLSKLRKQMESGGGKTGGGTTLTFTKEGAAQFILVGPPNSGKSSILNVLSNAHPEVADYPFTTHQMYPGMIPYKDIQLQLIDTPPVTPDYMPPHLFGLVRSADAVLFVTDLENDSLIEDLDVVIQAFNSRHVFFTKDIERRDKDHILSRILANKRDVPDAETRLALLEEWIGDRFEILPISTNDSEGMKELPALLFDWLDIVRVYTKVPGQKADMVHPYTVFKGKTVEDICALVHKDFYENLKFARLWRGDSPPLTVSRNEQVEDGDILELHM